MRYPFFALIYYLDKIAHKLGYLPSREHRVWFCIYAEDRLTEIALLDHRGEGRDHCFWCRRYYPYD